MLQLHWTDLKKQNEAFTFDDVLIVPNKSDMKSRRDPELRTQLTKNTVIVRTHNAMENTLQTQLSAHNAALTSRIEARLNQQLSPISVKGNTL